MTALGRALSSTSGEIPDSPYPEILSMDAEEVVLLLRIVVSSRFLSLFLDTSREAEQEYHVGCLFQLRLRGKRPKMAARQSGA